MSGAFIGCVLAVSQLSVAWYGDHHRKPVVATCDDCGVESARIFNLIETLQHNPNWRRRDDAAHELRRFDWKCHPVVAEVLATALLSDCHPEVREEAAESLAKIKPCLPIVHEALARATRDRDLCTRLNAKRALKNLGRNCKGDCRVCDPTVLVQERTILRSPFALPTEPIDVQPRMEIEPETLPDPIPDTRLEPLPPPRGSSRPDELKLEPPLRGTSRDRSRVVYRSR